MKRKNAKKHETEQKYPEQCAEYELIVNELYKLHLEKNREYSPNNIRSLGVLGCALRMHEKTVRLLNLLGWDTWEGKPTKPLTEVKFGGIEEELKDIANISIISQILSKNKWAK